MLINMRGADLRTKFNKLLSALAVASVMVLAACSGSGSDSSSGGGGSAGGGSAGPLEGCWYSTALATSWCFTGTTGEIRTESNNGIPATQISGLVQMTFTSSTMTYRIDRAAVQYSDGSYAYDKTNLNQGPYTQLYALSSTGSAFTSGSGTYTRTSGGGGGTTPPSTTTGRISVWSSRATTETGSITVKIDNVYAGSLDSYFTSAPTCGAIGTVTKTLTVGTHSLSGADGTLTWGPTSFSITAGGCLMYGLN